MPKKLMSTMGAIEFSQNLAALGLTRATAAHVLELKEATVRNYASERYQSAHRTGFTIPEAVASRVNELVSIRFRYLLGAILAEKISIENVVAALITYNSRYGQLPEYHHPPPTLGRFMRRSTSMTGSYPVYRMTLERYTTYLFALKQWQLHVISLAGKYVSAAHQREYHMELDDLKALHASAPLHAPYDITLRRSEWGCVSRALMHLARTTVSPKSSLRDAANALYSHWNKHRHGGYPYK